MELKLDVDVVSKKLFTTNLDIILLEGGRGGAKSEDVATYLMLEALNKPESIILCTREFQNSIKESVFSLLSRKMREKGLVGTAFQVTDNKITCVNGSKFIFSGLARNIGSIKSLDNITHCWVEEGQYITKDSVDVLDPTLRKEGVKLIVTMNRLLDYDPIYKLLTTDYKELCEHIYVTYKENNFCSAMFKRKAELCKLNNPDEYENKYMGKPLIQGHDCILDRTLIRQAMNRSPEEVDQTGVTQWGIDVARKGDDNTEITQRKGLATLSQFTMSKKRSYEIYKYVTDRVVDKLAEKIKIDDTGVGGGTCDKFYENKYNLQEIVFNEVAKNQDRYDSKISEMWFEFADLVKNYKISIPNNEALYEELITRTFEIDRKGRRCVTSKKDTKKLLHRSPDKADSLLLAYYDLDCYNGFDDGIKRQVEQKYYDNDETEDFEDETKILNGAW